MKNVWAVVKEIDNEFLRLATQAFYILGNSFEKNILLYRICPTYHALSSHVLEEEINLHIVQSLRS